MQPQHFQGSGFTLIEMSIMLVIIGLISGGILMGTDMIDDAAVRAQVSQITKYNTAVHTFQVKYGYLPGDIPDPCASNFGFVARGSYTGMGDGNGILEGVSSDAPGVDSGTQGGAGEVVMFWRDLNTANLIEGNFPYANPSTPPGMISSFTSPSLNQILPYAKYASGWGRNNMYVYTYSFNNQNRFGISLIYDVATSIGWNSTTLGFKVIDAYNIDKKIDDGLPQSGSIIAQYINRYYTGGNNLVWSYGGGNAGSGGTNNYSYTIPINGTSRTCFDNGGVGGNPQGYSISQNGGAGQNCALSFIFQ